MQQTFDNAKFTELVHYVCHKSDREKLGAVKLNKILWFSDIFNFLSWGKSITGESYIKRQRGPVPRHVLTALDKLKNEGAINMSERNVYGYTQREFISLKTPNIDMFAPHEISLIDEVIDTITNGHTATSISELTHDEIWEMAEIGESIPYEAVMVANLGEIDEHDIAWAKGLLAIGGNA